VKILSSILRKIRPMTALLAFVAMVCLMLFLFYAKTPVSSRDRAATIDIPKGAGFWQIVDILDREGLVNNRLLFYAVAMANGARRSIKAGEYEMDGGMGPAEIIRKLVRGEIKTYTVTIPEDFTLKQIAERLDADRLVDEKIFIDVAADRQFLASLKIQAPSAEGYLYPDTYALNRAMTTREIVRIMVNQFWKKVTPEMLARAQALHLSTHEFVTLASLIGKETGYRDEKTLVSGVFHNRLRKGMRLQSDPTAIYDLRNFSSTVKRRHLDNDSPYNTYRIKGLPPGPIANPGIDSLRAALYPASVDYLYFVSNNDGTHRFSSTLIAHNEAVSKYQIKRQNE
jgi:UPF0755 protein